jgi:hypothetical protein
MFSVMGNLGIINLLLFAVITFQFGFDRIEYAYIYI